MRINRDYEKIFSHLTPIKPPQDLLARIMLRIQQEKHLVIIKKRLLFFSAALIISVIGFFPAFSALHQSLIASGFIDFLSLIFSDLGAVVFNWQNYILILLESLPIISLVAILTVFFVFLESIRFLVRDLKNVFSLKQLNYN